MSALFAGVNVKVAAAAFATSGVILMTYTSKYDDLLGDFFSMGTEHAGTQHDVISSVLSFSPLYSVLSCAQNKEKRPLPLMDVQYDDRNERGD